MFLQRLIITLFFFLLDLRNFSNIIYLREKHATWNVFSFIEERYRRQYYNCDGLMFCFFLVDHVFLFFFN